MSIGTVQLAFQLSHLFGTWLEVVKKVTVLMMAKEAQGQRGFLAVRMCCGAQSLHVPCSGKSAKNKVFFLTSSASQLHPVPNLRPVLYWSR